MSQIVNVSAIDFGSTIKLHELNETQRHTLPISSYRLPNRSHNVISWYQDDMWRFEDARFPSNTADSQKKLDFERIPTRFVPATKFAIKHFDIKKNPAGGVLVGLFNNLKPFFRYLDSLNIKNIADITPLVCANYVQQAKGETSQRGKPLQRGTLAKRFSAVEILHKHLRHTQWSFPHPWEESSALHLAGQTGQSSMPKAKTEFIDENQLKVLIPYCHELIEQAEDLTVISQLIRAKRFELRATGLTQPNVNKRIRETILTPNGFAGLKEFNRRYNDIPIATAIIILTFSGIRNHELCAIEWNDFDPDRDAYRIEDNGDDIYYWLKSHSSKTHEGYTEWLVPKIVINAIEAQKIYVSPLRDVLWQEQQAFFAEDPHHHKALKTEGFKNHLFLTKASQQSNRINTMTS